MYWVKKAILRKRETVYGTDPTPGVADAVIAQEMDANAYDHDEVGRPVLRPWMGHGAISLPANEKAQLAYFVELAGAGAAGTAPKWGLELRCCGFSETVNGGVDVQYSPVSAAIDSMTAYWNVDGQRVRMNGLRGSGKFEFRSGEPPRLRLAYTGLPLAPDDSAMPAADFTGWTDPLVVNKVNTPTLTLHGFACALYSMDIDLANVVGFRDLVNAKDVQVTNRLPTLTITIEAPTIAQKNYFGNIGPTPTIAALQLIHGVGAGKIVQLDAPKVQLLKPRYGEVNGITTLTMDGKLHPNAGNDEIKVTVK